MRCVTTTGVDRRNEGVDGAAPSLRLRANGTIMPRNAIVGEPIHRVDMRIQKRLPIVGRLTVDGMLEVFNLFNHANHLPPVFLLAPSPVAGTLYRFSA